MSLLKTLCRTMSILSLLCAPVLVVVPRVGHAEDSPPRPLYHDTALVRAGEPAAWVIYPSSQAVYREQAERIVTAVKARTGVALPLLPDTEVTATNHPVLLNPYRNRNLILLGRLGINRAIWGVYNRFLCAVDGYYPGGEGYVLRTAANVYNTGANTLIAGGSSEAGAARAAERLIARIAETPPDARGDLVLPWLLDVELGGECRETFDADEQRQMARDFPGNPAAHGNNPYRRFYENIMSWYWSGRESYLALGLRYLDLVMERYEAMPPDERRFRIGHYPAEFFVRAYNMLDDSGRLSAERIRRVDRALVDTSLRHFGLDPRESSYRSGLKRRLAEGLVDEIVTADHQNASWLADKVLADFILDKIPETSETAEAYAAARERRALYLELFDRLIAERWRGSVAAASTTVPVMTYSRYALEMERYAEWFDSGNARRAALYHLARVDTQGMDIGLQNRTLSGWTEFGLFLGIAASYDGDGELRAALDARPGMLMGHYGCYLLGVHTYRPGPEVPPAEPRSLLGATHLPLQPVHFWRMKTGFRDTPDTTLEYAETFDLATLRSGFSAGDDYLLLYGGYGAQNDLPGNTLVKLLMGGRTWLMHTAESRPFDQNALQVTRDGIAGLETPVTPPAARLEQIGNTPSAAWISSTLPGVADADWNRRILHLPERFVLVIDRVTAQLDDTYRVTANWRPNRYGRNRMRFSGIGPARGGTLEGGRWIVRDDRMEFVMVPGGERVTLLPEIERAGRERVPTPVFRQRLSGTLTSGESLTVANLMFTRPVGSTLDYDLRETADGGWVAQGGVAPNACFYVGPMPPELGRSDAPLVMLQADLLTVFNPAMLSLAEGLATPVTPAADESGRNADTSQDIALPEGLGRQTLERLWTEARPADLWSAAAGDEVPSMDASPLWHYEGARSPMLIETATLIDDNTWDLGGLFDLGQISAMTTGELPWEDRQAGVRYAGRLPERFEISMDGSPGGYREFAGDRRLVHVPSMQAYGRIELATHVFERLRAAPQPARFVRAVCTQAYAENQLLFYDAARQDPFADPLAVKVIDTGNGADPAILVHPDIWPGFRNVTRLEHAVTLLDGDGNERWRVEPDWRMLFARALDRDGTGRQEIFVGSLDNRVYVLNDAGRTVDALSVDGLFTYGQGGYPLAANLGLWQPDASGRRKPLLTRYCYVSFLDRDGTLEANLRPGIYWLTDILAKGSDLTGDGVENTAVMTSSHVYILEGHDVAGGRINLPSGPSNDTSGSPTLAFERFDADIPMLFVARENMVGLLDTRARRWPLAWTPDTPVAAAIALPDRREILCRTGDGRLWRIHLGADHAPSDIETFPSTAAFRRIARLDRARGAVVGASPRGLFRIESDNTLHLLASGSFHDVAVYPSADAPEMLIATRTDGAVEAYALRAKD